MKAGRLRYLADKRSTLFVAESDSSTTEHEAISTLEDPDEGEDGEDQGRPVDKARVSLVGKDGPERPGDGDGGGEIALGGGESIGGCCSLQEEEGEEDENFGPDACTMGETVDTEGIESGNDDEDGGPTVVKREGKVDEELVGIRLGCVVFLDNVVDVRNSRANKEGKDKGNNVVVRSPQVDVDGVEDTKKGEAP